MKITEEDIESALFKAHDTCLTMIKEKEENEKVHVTLVEGEMRYITRVHIGA